MRILLVEDDPDLGKYTQQGLEQFGYAVDWLKDGQSALQALSIETFDFVILDLSLPKLSGMQVLQAIRAETKDNNKNKATPVIILTADDTKHIQGLDSGADHYMTKPFDLNELGARLRALHRRSSGRPAPIVQYENITLDPGSHEVSVADKPVVLSRREFALLQKLLENPGHVFSRELLTQSLYGWEDDVDSNALEVHIHNLRKKLGGSYIRTIRGVGYMAEKECSDKTP